MSQIDGNQPLGTPTWLDLGVDDLDAARRFYGAVFGWEFAESELGTLCLLRGLPVAGLRQGADGFGWTVHLATDDCDVTAKAAASAGGTVVEAPHEVGALGRAATLVDPVGTRTGLWQGRSFPGYRLANEPDTLVRNDLVTAEPGPARAFYATVFDFTLDGNPDLPEYDFTFLRRPDGYEVGGVLGRPGTPRSAWSTTFEVADTDATVARAVAEGARSTTPEETIYGRSATLTDPFGAELDVIARP